MIKAIRKACFYLGLFGAMCVFMYGIATAAVQEVELREIEIRTVTRSAALNTPVQWGLEVPESVLPTMPARKPE